MPAANQKEQIARWFHKHILSDPRAHALLMEAVPGDDRWINVVHRQHIPGYFKDPTKMHLFRHGLRQLARPIWDVRDAAEDHQRKSQLGCDAQPATLTEKNTEEHDDASTVCNDHHSHCE